MTRWPDTERTLVQRLADPRDDAAWTRFDAMYRPVVYRYARSRGLQHSDAESLVSEVMSRVFRAASRWSNGSDDERDQRPTKFSAWLHRVAENALLNLVTRQLLRRGTGGTSHQLTMAGRAIPDDLAHTMWERQHRDHLFVTAAGLVQARVSPDHWSVFWQTHVDGVPIAEVAEQTGRSLGAIYAIRSRIIKHLREAVAGLERLDALELGEQSHA